MAVPGAFRPEKLLALPIGAGKINGPSGDGMPLLILKRKVKKMIEQEDKNDPLTDDQIAHILCNQGINVNRRTVAKYRADMKIPSTHQRRVKH